MKQKLLTKKIGGGGPNFFLRGGEITSRNDVHFFSFSEYGCHCDGQRREGRDLIIVMMYISFHFQSTDAIVTDSVVKAGI